MSSTSDLWIDHVLFSARDLDASERRFLAEHGLAAYDGGAHLEFGTANRIVPLGGQYLEVLGVADEDVAARNPIGRWALAAVARGDGPLHWNVGTSRLEDAADRLGLGIEEGTRTLPDGTVVAFRHLDTSRGLTDPLLPFYIGWDGDHPGARPVSHRLPATGIAWVELAVASDERLEELRRWLGGAELPLRIVRDEPEGLRAVAIAVDGAPEIIVR